MATKKKVFSIERKAQTRAMTIRFTDEDKELLSDLTARYEAKSESELIRHALRWLKETGGK